MDEATIKALVIQAPAVVLLLLWINSWIKVLYDDFKKERDLARAERTDMQDALGDLKNRVGRLEEHIIGDRAPTLHRSQLNGQTGTGS